MILKTLVSMATLAALIALSGLRETAQGRKAVEQRVRPVVAQYREVLSWED